MCGSDSLSLISTPLNTSIQTRCRARQGYDGRTADVWSCGVILFVMIAGCLPFDEPTLVALFGKIQRAEFSYPR